MRIGLNLLHALPEIGGGWTYIANVVAALAREDRENDYVAFVTEASATLVPQQTNFRVVPARIDSRVRARRVLHEQTVLQLLAWRHRLDCLHWFGNCKGIINVAPPVVTIFDLHPFLGYAKFAASKRAYLRWRLRATVKGDAVLLPMSHSTADDLEKLLGASKRRMSVIPPMLESLFTPASADAVTRCRSRYRLPATFWLYVSHFYPHKNHERLLRAYARVRRQDCTAWPLVLRGEPRPGAPDIPSLVAELGLGEAVIVLPWLPRDDLPALYGAASALIFPSLYEGCGIPLLEAQACGCPIVAADIPAVREFAGDAARLFDPRDVSDIQRAMASVANDGAALDALRQRGLEQALELRSAPVVERLQDAYRRAPQTARR